MPAPDFLDAGGAASMATMLMMSHHAFRRDLARFARALADDPPPRAAALAEEWKGYHAALHGHHAMEDGTILPGLAKDHPEVAPVVAALGEDHRRIDPLLARGDAAFGRIRERGAARDAAAVVAELKAFLDPHLAKEEAEIVPFLRKVLRFEVPPLDEAMVALYAEGFAWSSHGVAPDVLDRVYAMLPEGLRSRLPAARAAFAARCERVWGTAAAGASRTPVPDGP